MALDQRETKNWITTVAKHMGLSPSQLSLNSGMAASTVTRYLNDQSNTVGISQASLEKIAHYSGFRPHQMPGQVRNEGASEVIPFRRDLASFEDWVVSAVEKAVAAKNGIGAWLVRAASLDGMGVLPGDIILVDHAKRPSAGDVVLVEVKSHSQAEPEKRMRVWQPPFVLSHSMRLGPQRPEQVDEDLVVLYGTRVGLIRSSH